jgi:hypothetical protein
MLKVVSLPSIGGVGNGLMLIIVSLLTSGVTGKLWLFRNPKLGELDK